MNPQASKSKVALSIIAKNEEATIANCINSVLPYVDAVYLLDTGSTDKTVEIATALGANVSVSTDFNYTVTKEDEQWTKEHLGPVSRLKDGDKLFRFGKARNYALSLIPKQFEWILWLDADDVFQGGQNIRKMIEQAEMRGGTAVFLNYLYQNEFNPDGSIKNVIIEHLRERLFRNNGTYVWKGEIHETLIAEKAHLNVDSKDAAVVHTISGQEISDSIDRNIRNLEFEIKDTNAEDPRPIYYLAKAYFDLGTDDARREAERLIREGYLKASGWGEERSQAWDYVGWIRRHFQDGNNTIKAAHNALAENPLMPSPYITLAEGYLIKGQWQFALHWAKIAATIPAQETTLINNKIEDAVRTLNVVYTACMNMGMFEEAWGAAVKLKDIADGRQGINELYDQANNIRIERELTTHAGELIRFYGDNKFTEGVQQIAGSLPPQIYNNQVIQTLLLQYLPPRKHGEKEITIFCGPGFEIWNPQTIEEQGSGGSEEAVYRLSKELTKIGYKVTIYANPGSQKGKHEGVEYKNYYEINWKDQFNIVIAWRHPEIADMGLSAKRLYIWLHDVPMIKDYPPDRVFNIDKVIVLSEYHASLVDLRKIEGRVFGIPREKVLVSRNGVSL